MDDQQTELEMLRQQFSDSKLDNIDTPDDNDMPSQIPEVLNGQSE